MSRLIVQYQCLLAAIAWMVAGGAWAGMGWGAETPVEVREQRRGAIAEFEGLNSEDLVCGPRCVQYILESNGQHADLIDLIREMQWPDLEHGVDLEAIDTALRDRGVHTFAMRLSPNARLKWPYPAIVHLARERERLGHFVVWLPTSSHDVDLWCGPRGVRRLSQGDFQAEFSGAVLLTAPEQIRDPELAVERDALRACLQPSLVGICVLVTCVCVFFWVRNVR